MMFQKTYNGTGVTAAGAPALTSDLNVERDFARARKLTAARVNRSTANCGMFSRPSRVYRHV